jgi:hypothetical protein
MSNIEAFWENATADDVARVMAGETVEARFRDIETDPWCSPRDLTGCKAVGDGKLRWFTLTSSWRYCQVYREPSWYTNKPDPGLGCRLLEKLPDEELKPGDEYFDRPTGRWHLSGHAKTQQQQLTETWYRRRIEPVEPEPKHYVLRVGDSCETPNGNRIKVISQDGTQSFVNFGVGDKVKTIHGQTITITEKGFEVTQ